MNSIPAQTFPKRHGVLLVKAEEPLCAFGISRIFDPWVNPDLQFRQGFTSPVSTRHTKIEFHFRRVVARLFISLGHLQQQMQAWDKFLAAGALNSSKPELVFTIPEDGGIAADSVFFYLNLFADSLARMVPLVMSEGTSFKPQEPDSFNNLMRLFSNGKCPVWATDTLKRLFLELDGISSWWTLGFVPGKGIRQRLTHYTDLVVFQGSTKPGDSEMSADIALGSIGGPVHIPDLRRTLTELLAKLCVWLDCLELELLRHLCDTLAKKNVYWDPINEPSPALTLPKIGEISSNDSHYLFLPVCRESI